MAAFQSNNNEIDILDRINAMLSHETNSSISQHCHNYHTSQVDAPCRRAMVDWCFIVCDSIPHLHRETVSITMSILDRYLCSNKGRSASALHGERCKEMFQLAAVTAFYMAIKLNGLARIEELIRICRGYYSKEDIFEMERDILDALDWRLSLSSATPMEYVREFMALLLRKEECSSSMPVAVVEEGVVNVIIELHK